ncbi:MAG: TonB-dependent receptor [Halieaceae bacterium]|jgi:vitamin B12 transporter|nr:TonB-dependent receptor [Halieaceae bacterium]
MKTKEKEIEEQWTPASSVARHTRHPRQPRYRHARLHAWHGSWSPHGVAAGCLAAIGLLSPAAVAQNYFEEVVVTSSRVPTTLRETGTSISVLVADEIEQRGFLNLTELLRTQTSVAASNNGGAGKATSLRIRGEDGYRTMVFLDGIDIADTSSPQVTPRLEQLLASGIERVEILRGPQGLNYGADAGGVINISTRRREDDFGGRVSAEAGGYGTQQLSAEAGGALGAFDASFQAASFETEGFNARDLDTAPADRDGYENTTLHGRMGFDVSETLRLEAVGRVVSANNEYDSCSDASFSPTDNCEDEFEQDNLRLAAEYSPGSAFHQLSYTNSRTDRAFFAEGSEFFAAEGGLERFGYLGSWRASKALNLVYGVDHETESIDDGSFDRDRDQTGVFAEYQGTVADALTLTAGARWDDNEDFGDFTNYRLSAAYVAELAASQLKFRGSYGTGFRAPSLYEISYNRGPFAAPPAAGTALREERSAGYDVGLTWASDGGAWVELVWFDQAIDDLIVFDLIGFSGYLQDGGESSSRGIELSGELPLGGGFALSGNYSWNDTQTPEGEQRPLRPQQLFNLGLSRSGSDLRLRYGLQLRAVYDTLDTQGGDADDYLLVDANVSYRVTSALLAYARLENALDEDYQEVPSYNTAGRTAFAGIRYDF